MNTSSSIFITGATGFIGSYIVRLLFNKGYSKVIGLKRPDSSLDLLGSCAEKVTWLDGDLFDIETLNQGMKVADIAIHSAGLVSFYRGDLKELMRTNMQGTANMVNSALENEIKQFHHVSSISTLGRTIGQPLVTEQSHFKKGPLDTNYSLSKHLAEMEVWRGSAEGLSVSIINPSIVLGAGRWMQGSPAYFSTVAKGLRFYPIGATGFVDVRDVARMSIQILEENHKDERFICNGWNGSHQEMISRISQQMNKKIPNLPVSQGLGSIAWRLEWLRSRMRGRKPIITRETLRVARERFSFDNSKSVRILNFTYTSIENTIRDIGLAYLQSSENQYDFGLLEYG